MRQCSGKLMKDDFYACCCAPVSAQLCTTCLCVWKVSGHLVNLQDLYKSRSPLYDDENIVATRLQAVYAFGRLLQKTGAILDASEPELRQLYRQVDILSILDALHYWASLGDSYRARCELSSLVAQQEHLEQLPCLCACRCILILLQC